MGTVCFIQFAAKMFYIFGSYLKVNTIFWRPFSRIRIGNLLVARPTQLGGEKNFVIALLGDKTILKVIFQPEKKGALSFCLLWEGLYVHIVWRGRGDLLLLRAGVYQGLSPAPDRALAGLL